MKGWVPVGNLFGKPRGRDVIHPSGFPLELSMGQVQPGRSARQLLQYRYQRRPNPPLAPNTLLRAGDESQESGQRPDLPPGYIGPNNQYVHEI